MILVPRYVRPPSGKLREIAELTQLHTGSLIQAGTEKYTGDAINQRRFLHASENSRQVKFSKVWKSLFVKIDVTTISYHPNDRRFKRRLLNEWKTPNLPNEWCVMYKSRTVSTRSTKSSKNHRPTSWQQYTSRLRDCGDLSIIPIQRLLLVYKTLSAVLHPIHLDVLCHSNAHFRVFESARSALLCSS
jgi:hypothetical protein